METCIELQVDACFCVRKLADRLYLITFLNYAARDIPNFRALIISKR